MSSTRTKLQSAAGRLLVAVSLTAGLLGLMSGPAAHAASNASDAACSLSAATTTANSADYSTCTASQRSQLASLGRYTAMTNAYLSVPRHSTWVGGLLTAPALSADALRYSAMAARYLTDHHLMSRAEQAAAARWENLAASYHSVSRDFDLGAAYAAEAARWTALAEDFRP